jgi:hypothetical protein
LYIAAPARAGDRTNTRAPAKPVTAGERQRLVAHLEMTASWLASEVAGLSEAQLTFRPSPTAWSVEDVVEHLGIAEPQYWKPLEDSLKAPATGDTPRRPTPASCGTASTARTGRPRARQPHILQIREIKASGGYPTR